MIVNTASRVASTRFGCVEEGYFRVEDEIVTLITAQGTQRNDRIGKPIEQQAYQASFPDQAVRFQPQNSLSKTRRLRAFGFYHVSILRNSGSCSVGLSRKALRDSLAVGLSGPQ